MNKLNKNEKNYIDSYYNEGSSETNPDFEARLNDSLNAMDVFEDELINIPTDFFSIIEEAQQIKERRDAKKEFIIFLLASLAITLTVGAIAIFSDAGFRYIGIIFIFVALLLPFSLIPISMSVLKRSEV